MWACINCFTVSIKIQIRHEWIASIKGGREGERIYIYSKIDAGTYKQRCAHTSMETTM